MAGEGGQGARETSGKESGRASEGGQGARETCGKEPQHGRETGGDTAGRVSGRA